MTARRARRAATVAAVATILATGCGEAADPVPVATPVADGGVLRATPVEDEPDPEADEATDGTDADGAAADDDATDGDATDGDATDGDEATDGDATDDDEATDDDATDDDAEPTDDESTAPTDADRARFVAAFRPADASDLQHVAADVDGDGERDLVFAWVGATSGQSRVALATWDGSAYEIGFEADGGPADRLSRIRVDDLTADGTTELVLLERRGDARASASVWSVRDAADVRALVAVGGCHDGSSTYGVVGVSFVLAADGSEEIHATCDESPLPPDVWRSDVYVWSDGAYRWRSDG